MPTLIPIEIPIQVRSSQSDIFEFHLREGRKITADFLIPDNPERLLRLTLDSVEVVRLLDEMAISTEMDTPTVGLVPENLAYEVTGSTFSAQQSEALKLARPTLRHYRFITGWTCLDALTEAIPSFAVVQKLLGQL
jgi:hypothetical protein